MGTKFLRYILAILCVSTILFSCKKEEDTQLRNFMPINVTVTQDGINTATIEWKDVNNASSYTILLYSNQEKTDLVAQRIVTENNCSFSDLISNQGYFYKICANNVDSKLSSKWQEGQFVFKRDKLFDTPTIGNDSVILNWNKTIPSLTSVSIQSDSVKYTISLTSQDINNRELVLKGLPSNTQYVAKIFIGETLIDEISFVTKSSDTNNDLYITPADNLIDIINNCSSGSTIHLSSGIYAYGDKEIVINNKSIYIESSSNNEDSIPEIHIKRISLKGNVGNVVIKNLALSGFALGGKSPTSKNDYFLDLNSDFISADSIAIEGCTIHYLENCAIRGSRGQGTQRVSFIGFTNCTLTDINSEGENQYEVFKLDSLQLGMFTLNNCTIYNTSHGLLNNRNNHNASMQIVIKNCTINDIGSTSSNPRKYLIECSNCNGIFDFENNIMANLKGYESSASWMSKGFSFGNCTSIGINNLFYNMPFTVQEVGEWSNSTDNYDDINPEFADSEIGDFSIGNTTISSKGIGRHY